MLETPRRVFIKGWYEKTDVPEPGLGAKTRAAAVREKKTTLAFRILTWAILPLIVLTMIPAFLSLRRILNPIRTHAAQAQTCMKGPCTVAQKYELTRLLYEDRVSLGQHPFLLGLFLRGSKSNEIHSLLASVQQRLFFDGVVRPLLKESEARMAGLNWETFSDYPAFFGGLQSFLGWRASPSAQEGGRDRGVHLRGSPAARISSFFPEDERVPGSEFAAEIDEWAAQVTPADPRPDQFASALASARRGEDLRKRRSRIRAGRSTRSSATDRREPRALGLEAHEGPRGMGPALHGALGDRGSAAGELPARRADTAKPFKANFDAS